MGVGIRLWLGTAVLALVVCAAYPLFYSPVTKAPGKQTVVRLMAIEYAIDLLEKTNRGDIGQQLLRISGGRSMEDKWRLLLMENSGSLGMTRRGIERLLCDDGWGHRFNVELKSRLRGRTPDPLLDLVPYEIVVWSNGSNGVNEFGQADDVMLCAESRPRALR